MVNDKDEIQKIQDMVIKHLMTAGKSNEEDAQEENEKNQIKMIFGESIFFRSTPMIKHL